MVKKSPENTTPAIVDNVEALEAKLKSMREAQLNSLSTLRSR